MAGATFGRAMALAHVTRTLTSTLMMAALVLAAPLALAQEREDVTGQVLAELSEAEIENRVQAVIDDYISRPEFVGMSVAVARGDHLIVDRGYGIADLEWNTPVDAGTPFRIGSVTKQFTAAAIMKLMEEGKLDLDDPLSEYVPEFDTGGRVVTIRQMLNHTSGIPEYTMQPGFFGRLSLIDVSDAELLQLVAGKPFDFEPGAGWRYSNTNYYLLGMIIAKASGRSYAAFMQDEFFTPLGLAHTRYGSESEIIPHRAQGYAFNPDTGLHSNDAAISMNTPGAGGALVSSAGDLVRWQIALTNGRAIRAASFEQMIASPVQMEQGTALYGFGLMVDRRDGQRVITHGGGINGFNSVLSWLPDSGLRVAVISNSEAMPSVIVQQRIIAALTTAEPLPPLRTARLSAAEAALRKFITDQVNDTLDYSTMTPQFADLVRENLAQGQSMLRPLGSIEEVSFLEVDLRDMDSYLVEFSNGEEWIFTIALGSEGRITLVTFRPATSEKAKCQTCRPRS